MAAAATQTLNGKKWHDLYPELGTGPTPIEPYISREYFEREQAPIFRKVWLNVGRVEQIPNPGDYFVKDLAVCKTSILIVRGKDGCVRAFHNMCAHRGNKLVADTSGTCKGLFTCKFHGWPMGLTARSATSRMRRVSSISTNPPSASPRFRSIPGKASSSSTSIPTRPRP